MGRLPDNYFGPKQRIKMLKEAYPADGSSILTTVTMVPMGTEALMVLIKATITIEGKEVANGHAFTDCPEEDKAVEKAETIAIGRALVNFGYPELQDDEVEEEPAKKVEAVKPKKEADEKTAKPTTRTSGGLGSRLAAPKTPEVEEESTESEEDDSTEESEDEDSESSEGETEEVPEVKKPPAGKTSREELLARYGKKK